ncbi:hypothetical protein [Streptomyces halstedii]|uniref:hypothetical protein n=1 Tax=Streptomyces halstedii TaxID=1944 RepID=UPI0019405D73|nr:hypothetical protein [Streptomyces halstedii]
MCWRPPGSDAGCGGRECYTIGPLPAGHHHPCHRAVWAERTETFIGQLGATRKTERTRLQADHDRALRVVAEIDAASTMNEASA